MNLTLLVQLIVPLLFLLDLVLQQLRSCFNPRAGTQIVGDEMVKIRAKIDRDANYQNNSWRDIFKN